MKEKIEIKPLDWDSKLFGVKCANLALKECITEYHEVKILDDLSSYDFVTIRNYNNDCVNNKFIGEKTNAFLVDVQVVFSKNVEIKYLDSHVKISNNVDPDSRLLCISRNNFVYSRFFRDPNINPILANSVYENWTKNSFNREDKFFAIYEDNNIVKGFFLFGFDNNNNLDQGQGFMVVDSDYQGQGVGKALINSIENFAYNKCSKKIFGGTQVDNIKMMNHFYKNGYVIESKNSIYHLWNIN